MLVRHTRPIFPMRHARSGLTLIDSGRPVPYGPSMIRGWRVRLVLATSLVLAAGLVLPSPASAAKKKKGKSGAPTITGTNVVTEAAGCTRLLVFLPGLNLSPGEHKQFLDTGVSKGYCTIGLAYANSKGANGYCKDQAGSDCHGGVRTEVVFGTDSTPLFDLPPASSVVNRLVAALKGTAWGTSKFLVGDQPNWGSITVAGHSQGAGNAALIGLERPVARVILFAGPNDLAGKKLPAWVTGVGQQTSGDKWFGLSHDGDDEYFIQEQAWGKFSISGPVQTADAPTGSHWLITTVNVKNPHMSLVVDKYLSGTTLNPTWNYLLT